MNPNIAIAILLTTFVLLIREYESFSVNSY